jgi:ankyrin repeat protein
MSRRIPPSVIAALAILLVGAAAHEKLLEMLDDRLTEGEILSYLQANERNMAIAEQQRALFRACEHGHEKVASWLLDRKQVDLNGRDDSGETCLHYALRKHGNMPLIEMLVKKGADIDAEGRNGETPLIRAMSSSRDAAVFFIEQGGNVGATWTDGKSLLHMASSTGSIAIVRALLEKGAEIDAGDPAGATPLHDAIASQATETVSYLISRGADVRTRVKSNYRTAIFSTDASHPNISHFEFPAGAGTLHLAALGGNEAIARMLTEKGADIAMRDAMGNQAIHYAAMGLRPEMLSFLLRSGADSNARNRQDGTPLHYVCSFSGDNDQALPLQVAAMKLLVMAGGDINARASSGETPMDLVANEQAREFLRSQLGI